MAPGCTAIAHSTATVVVSDLVAVVGLVPADLVALAGPGTVLSYCRTM